jgi:hypothetical protein
LALALRSYTESVMTDYYAWAALALALVVASRGSRIRFDVSIALAVTTTILAQWKLPWFPEDRRAAAGLVVWTVATLLALRVLEPELVPYFLAPSPYG